MRPKGSALRVGTAVGLAALLVAGCSGGDEEAPARATPQTTTATATPTAGLDQLTDQLEETAEQAGAEGFGALTCESVQGAVLAGQGPDATAEGLNQVLNSILAGAARGSESVKGADLDATMQQQCPDVRQDALQAAGVDSIEALVKS